MAKIASLPSLQIISGFKGTIDFYVNHQTCDPEFAGPGIPCARRWPRSPGHERSPAVMAQWEAFTLASQLWNTLSPEVQAAYVSQATNSGYTGRDLMQKGFLSGIYGHPH